MRSNTVSERLRRPTRLSDMRLHSAPDAEIWGEYTRQAVRFAKTARFRHDSQAARAGDRHAGQDFSYEIEHVDAQRSQNNLSRCPARENQKCIGWWREAQQRSAKSGRDGA